jgi:hypothetical protein
MPEVRKLPCKHLPTAFEGVAWNLAGFLLVWRVAITPKVGKIGFTAGCSRYDLEKRKKTSVTLAFSQNQVNYLAIGSTA